MILVFPIFSEERGTSVHIKAMFCHALFWDVEFSRVAIYISEFIRFKKGL